MHSWDQGGARIGVLATLVAGLLAISSAPAVAEAGEARDIGSYACPDDLPDPFTDIEGSVHGQAIRCMVAYGFVNGTTSTTFTPGSDVTRGQLASFLARLLAATGVPLETTDQGFTDISESAHRDAINALAGLEVIQGTSATTFAPDLPVTRAQAASLVARVLDGFSALPEGPDTFVDDDGSVHEPNIDALATAGIVAGVTADRYDPDASVTRAAAASILARTQDLAVEERFAPPRGPIEALHAALSGTQEVPGPGDPVGQGSVELVRSAVDGLLCITWDIDVGLTDAPVAAHVHRADAGAAGPIVLELPLPEAGADDKVYELICDPDVDAAAVDAVFADPSGHYVNVHTGELPDGAIRGQLGRVDTTMRAFLSGEVAEPGPGEALALGIADVDVLADDTTICASVVYLGGSEPVAAHIHAGEAGTPGAIVATLPPFDDEGPVSDGCVGGLDPEVASDLAANPTDYYVDVHTEHHPDGAVRGQLEAVVVVAAALTGAAEAPGPGDPDGSGEATIVIAAEDVLCVNLAVRGIETPTAAHIHEGAAGVAGPIVVELPTPIFNTTSGCIEGIDPALVAAIADRPADFYVNVHNAGFPTGAVRGQLAAGGTPVAPLFLTDRQE